MKKVIFSMAAAGLFLASCVGNPEGEKAATGEAVETLATAGSPLNVDVAASSITWTGNKVTGSHTGTIKLQSGALMVAEGKLVGGNFVIDMNTLENTDLTDPEYKGKLEGHLKADDFFAVDKYPTAKFEITEVKEGTNGQASISGNLTIRETTKNITFNAAVTESSDTKVATNADFNINRKDWGVVYEGQKDDLISDEINFKVNLVANK